MASGPEQRRASLVAVLATAGAVLVLLVAVWAAGAGPDEVFRDNGPDPGRMTTSAPSEPTTTATLAAQPDADPTDEASDAGWIGVVLGLLLGLTGLLVLGVVTALAVHVVRRLGAPARSARPDDDPDLTVVAAVTQDAAAQEEILLATGGTPRNGIVECWHRFEVQADRAGIARKPWETSSEFTIRVLDLAGADGHAVARLAALYREARFSEHDVGEEHRAAALDALRRIHQGPRAAARAPVRAPARAPVRAPDSGVDP